MHIDTPTHQLIYIYNSVYVYVCVSLSALFSKQIKCCQASIQSAKLLPLLLLLL